MAHEIDTSIGLPIMICTSEKPSSTETPEDRYVRQVNAMLLDAIACDSLVELADTLAWGLAIIANQCDTELEVAGAILQQLGRQIRSVAEQDRAKSEAEESRQRGEVFQ